MRSLPLAALAALALGACATAQLDTGKTLAAAQSAVAAATTGVHQAYAAGLISKAQVAGADALVDRADTAGKAARAAYAAGDLSTAQAAVATMTALAVQIIAMEKPL
jgi:hypothetical protein